MIRTAMALGLSSFALCALAAPPFVGPVDVNVTNPVLPVEVSNADPVLVRDADRSSTEPFQAGTVPTAFSGTVISLSILTVPAGKRLVIEHASAWINTSGPDGLLAASISVQGESGVTDALACQKLGANALNHITQCASQTKIYAGPGKTVVFASEAFNSSGGFARAFVSGYYVPAP